MGTGETGLFVLSGPHCQVRDRSVTVKPQSSGRGPHRTDTLIDATGLHSEGIRMDWPLPSTPKGALTPWVNVDSCR